MLINNFNQNIINIFKKIKEHFIKSESAYSYNLLKQLPEKKYPEYLKKIYFQHTNKILNLKNPKTFTEKIQWLKLYDNSPLKTKLSDKLFVKDYAVNKVAGLKAAKVYGVWNSFEEIDFSICPDCFFIKTNHASKNIIKILDKNEFLQRKNYELSLVVNGWLNIDYEFQSGFEMQYKGIPHRVFIEELLGNKDEQWLTDYKIFCFNGKPAFIECHSARHMPGNCDRDEMALYDVNWKKLNFYHGMHFDETKLPKPENLEFMVDCARELSKDFKFVRVDLFSCNKNVYIAELTFTPCSGFMIFHPEKYDMELGNMLQL